MVVASTEVDLYEEAGLFRLEERLNDAIWEFSCDYLQYNREDLFREALEKLGLWVEDEVLEEWLEGEEINGSSEAYDSLERTIRMAIEWSMGDQVVLSDQEVLGMFEEELYEDVKDAPYLGEVVANALEALEGDAFASLWPEGRKEEEGDYESWPGWRHGLPRWWLDFLSQLKESDPDFRFRFKGSDLRNITVELDLGEWRSGWYGEEISELLVAALGLLSGIAFPPGTDLEMAQVILELAGRGEGLKEIADGFRDWLWYRVDSATYELRRHRFQDEVNRRWDRACPDIRDHLLDAAKDEGLFNYEPFSSLRVAA